MCNMHRWRRRNAMPDEVLVISGNSKIGLIPSASLLPIVTCDRSAPCTKSGCYAHALEFRAGAVWQHNTDLATGDPSQFFSSLTEQFAAREVPLFRFFVSGDFPTVRFFRLAMQFMADHPATRFLVFTKRYRWVAVWLEKNAMPENTSLVLSAWPGHKMVNPHFLPVAWMQDGSETRVPGNAIPCHGSCESCGMCWSLADIARDVVFSKH